jgi:hypothetical protein
MPSASCFIDEKWKWERVKDMVEAQNLNVIVKDFGPDKVEICGKDASQLEDIFAKVRKRMDNAKT